MNWLCTLKGEIVLAPGVFNATPEQKEALDKLHRRKIELADKVVVINVGDYIGDSTRSEINYAEFLGKPIEYLVPRRNGGS